MPRTAFTAKTFAVKKIMAQRRMRKGDIVVPAMVGELFGGVVKPVCLGGWVGIASCPK